MMRQAFLRVLLFLLPFVLFAIYAALLYGVILLLHVTLTLPGFAFAWWARLHLGKLWSGWVVRKEGHRIVDSGPSGSSKITLGSQPL